MVHGSYGALLLNALGVCDAVEGRFVAAYFEIEAAEKVVGPRVLAFRAGAAAMEEICRDVGSHQVNVTQPNLLIRKEFSGGLQAGGSVLISINEHAKVGGEFEAFPVETFSDGAAKHLVAYHGIAFAK